MTEVPIATAPAPTPSTPEVPPAAPARRGVFRRVLGLVPTLLALAMLAGVVVAGQANGWKVPKASALMGEEEKHEEDDWCDEHSVPESVCVECHPELVGDRPRGQWNKEFGVPDCPFEVPGVAQTAEPASVDPEDVDRARRALAFAPRPTNSRNCKLHDPRVQLASPEVMASLGITVEPVGRQRIVEGVTAPGEISHDPTRVAHVSARLSGVVRRVVRQPGDRVSAGDLLALVDAAEVGKAKAEYQQALALVELREQSLTQKRALEGATVTGQEVREAEAALEEAQVRVLLAEQALANLDLPVSAGAVQKASWKLSPSNLVVYLRFLGIPQHLLVELTQETASSNLLPVRAPIDGEIIARTAALGEPTGPAQPLFTVADTGRVWLTLRVRYEDANRVKPGQPVEFRTAELVAPVAGTVTWVSPAADPKTRTVPVRVEITSGIRPRAGAFGTGFVSLRDEPRAIVVPADAVHWEGCCHVVFVADRDFDTGYKLFHVRKVRIGATGTSASGTPVIEIIVGVLPGERIAVVNSGILRSQLLRSQLGEGCCGHSH